MFPIFPHPSLFPSVKMVCLRFLYALVIFTTLLLPPPAWSENQTDGSQTSPEQMAASLENALSSHRAELADLKTQMQQLEKFQDAFRIEIETYESQTTIHRQLLLTAQLRIEDLESAIRNNQLGLKTLDGRIDKFQKQWEATSLLFQNAENRIELARKQMDEIRQFQLSDVQKQQLEESTETLLLVLKQKQQFGKLFQKTYEDLLNRMKEVQKIKKAIGEKLATRLETQEKHSLFNRSTPYSDLMGEKFSENLNFFLKKITSVFSPETWAAQWQQIKMGRIEQWVIFLVLLGSIILFQGRCRAIFQRAEAKHDGPNGYYRQLGLQLLGSSLPTLGMMAAFSIYNYYRFSLFNIGLGRVLLQVFMIRLVACWGLDYLNQAVNGMVTEFRVFVSFHLERFFRFYQVAGICIVLLIWVAGRDSLLIWIVLTVLFAVLLVWEIFFWGRIKPVLRKGARGGQTAPSSKWMTKVKWGNYFVIYVALFLNLIGYDILALQWITSWTETGVLIFWGWISLNIIREWQEDHQAKVEKEKNNETDLMSSAHHWQWTQIKLAGALWLFALSALILWAWDPLGSLKSALGYAIEYPLSIGTLNFSIKGIASAVLILFLTQLGVRLGRAVITEKILDKYAFERGLKDSILTISSYFSWGVALLLALGILGVNATSLAVVFGALSVGIGFGLQNIVNNFISGLILLFERPIQVGDYVEIAGLWAEVKQINVRTTVVRTFDNATLIIPNSDFISKQVTNWTIADRRIRRNLEVRTVYGSDIELVQNTLMEIIQNESDVLKYPQPSVLLLDHSASGLVFRMRIWLDADDYLTVPSRILIEMDRRFRELGIEFAFPRQEVHIRADAGETASGDALGEPDVGWLGGETGERGVIKSK